MAKAKQAGKGRKLCVCGEYVGVRVKTHSCGHVFDIKSGPKTSKHAGIDLEKAALKFAFLTCKNVADALKQVENYQENELSQFIAVCGGQDKAKEELNRLVK